MIWIASHRAEPSALALADRHYNRQKPGTPQFVPPGRCLVFTTRCEGAGLSSELIRDAVAATRSIWEPPALGIVSFVDTSQVRRKRDPGRCYRKAGWRHVGFTKGGLWAFQQLPAEMPEPQRLFEAQLRMAI